MSNLTDFFPSTGGSSDITDPKLLPRLQVPVSGLIMKNYFASTSTSIQANLGYQFWAPFFAASMSESFSGLELSTTYNTYETILDVSSSTNGGYLNHVVGSSLAASQTETYKITVDGVATEIVRTTPASGLRGILGWVAPGGNPPISVAGQPGGPGSMGEQAYYMSVVGNQSAVAGSTDVTNGFIYSANSYYTMPNAPWAYPALKFKETLKVEIKRSGRQTSTVVYNYAGVRHTMI
jgi:hypothetical protein